MTAKKIAHQDYPGAVRVFRLSLVLLAASGLTLSLALFFGAYWLIDHQIIRDPRALYSLIALSPAIFFVTILSSFRGYLQGCQQMTPTAVSQIAEQIFRVGAMVLFASLLLPRGLEFAAGGASLGAAAGAVAGLAVLLYYYYKLKQQQTTQPLLPRTRESSITIIRSLAALTLPVSLSSILLPLVANTDLLIVPRRLEAAGYSVEQATEFYGYLTGMAVPLVNLATIFTAALATNIVPAIAAAVSTGDTNAIKLRISSSVRLTYFVSFPGVVFLLLLAQPIATFIYNAPKAAPAVEVLSLAVLLLGVHQATTAILQGLGKTLIPVINMGLAALLKIVLNWTLTAQPQLGIKGAAWATVADLGLAALLNCCYIWRYWNYSFNLTILSKTLTAAAVMGASILLVFKLSAYYQVDTGLSTVLSVLISLTAYSVCLLFFGAVKEQDIERIPWAGSYLKLVLTRLHILK